MKTQNSNLDVLNSNLLGEDFSYAHGKKKHKLKDFIKKEKDAIKKGIKNEKAKIKKVVKKLKDKVGSVGKKLRNKFRSILRKNIVFGIKHNVHGMAAKLYPAVASQEEIKKRRYKASYVAKSKKIYAELIDRWKGLGGDEKDMKNAITEGSSKGFLKSPYKSFSGNNSDDFYNYYSYIADKHYGADSSTDDDNTPPDTTTTTDTATTDSTDTTTTVDEVPDKGETVKAKKGFFAWLASLFHKHGAKENPYEDGTPAAATFSSNAKADAGNEPKPEEANNDAIKSIVETSKTDDAGGKTDTEKSDDSKVDETTDDGTSTEEKKASGVNVSSDKIFGFDKKKVIIGSAIGGILLITGIVIAIHASKGNKSKALAASIPTV
jgi:hypothetical protein